MCVFKKTKLEPGTKMTIYYLNTWFLTINLGPISIKGSKFIFN